ncbi:MAG: hypothetical protein Q8930_06890 [Bacillota bacterium]|nr:hypothetical protein [Bacillota bacterium]
MNKRYDYSNKEGNKILRLKFIAFYLPFILTIPPAVFVNLIAPENSMLEDIIALLFNGCLLLAIAGLIRHHTWKNQLKKSYIYESDFGITYNFMKKGPAIDNNGDICTVWYEYNFDNITSMENRNKDIVVYGNMEQVINFDNSEHTRKKVNSLTLPKVFNDMAELISCIQSLVRS